MHLCPDIRRRGGFFQRRAEGKEQVYGGQDLVLGALVYPLEVVAFIDKMTRINKGRAFYTNPEKLGEYVLVDYLSGRKQRVV